MHMHAIKRILVATNFSIDPVTCLEYAKQIARRFCAQITLLHIDEPSSVVSGSDLAAHPSLRVQSPLDDVVKELRDQNLRAEAIARRGISATEIVTLAAETTADLIIIGAPRTGLAHAGIGHLVDRVVREAPCPVLTVCQLDRENHETDTTESRIMAIVAP
jgi:nucleotide-binding universal stress UspA family protein